MINLKQKNILITGASSGIGRDLAVLCANLGANVYATGRDQNKLKATGNLISTQNFTLITADLTSEEEINALVGQLPSLDGIVHLAGKIFPMPVKFIRSKHIKDVFDTNYSSSVLLMSELIKNDKLNRNASLIFMSSVSAQHPYVGGALYVSTKAAIEAYAKSLALELIGKKVRVNILSPGLIKTAILDETLAAAGPEKSAEYEREYPFGFGETSDVNNITAFLLSDLSRWITGQNIVLDGGLTLGIK